MKISLARAITGGTIIATILSLTVISGYSYYSSRKALVANARTIMIAHTRNVEQQTKLLLDPVVPLASSMADVVSRNGSPLQKEESIYRFLVEKLKDLPTIYSVYWADTKGQFFLVGRRPLKGNPGTIGFFLRTIRIANGTRHVTETWFSPDGHEKLLSTSLPTDPFDPRARPWYLAAAAAEKPAWTKPYIFYITKKPGITYAVPQFRDGALRGVCAVDLETESLSLYLQQILPTPGSRIFALTTTGEVVGFSDPTRMTARTDPAAADSLSIDNLGDNVAASTYHSFNSREAVESVRSGSLDINGETFHTQTKTAVIQGLPLTIGLAIPDGELFAPLVQSRVTVLGFSLAIMLFVTAAGVVFSRSVALPMEELRRAAINVEERKFDKIISLDTCFEEIGVTLSAFGRMQESLKEYLEMTRQLNENLQGAHLESLYRLAVAAEYRDRDTATHLNRVSAYSREIAELLGLPEEDRETLSHASLMHDVGKIGIPDEILMKPGKFDEEERKIMQEHTAIGGRILSEPTSKEMKMARVIAMSHHEKWDGSGYPAGLAGDEIPLWGRIVAIADVMDSLLSHRPYKKPMNFDQVLEYIQQEAGIHFDPAMATIVLENRDRFREITHRFNTTDMFQA